MITRITLLILIAGISIPCLSQVRPNFHTYLKKHIGLNETQIKAVHGREGFAKALPSRIPDEIFIFGAIYIHGRPESYISLSRDLNRLGSLPGYPAIGAFSSPPHPSDLIGFELDKEDIEALKTCKAGKCPVQMPAASIEEIRQSADWSTPDVVKHINQFLQEKALGRLSAYQREGNRALGVYNDKQSPVDVAAQFQYLLSYTKALPEYLPDFYNYLLSYPQAKPANVEDTFYWAKVKFGLKPTLRIVHVATMQWSEGRGPAYVIAEKQVYASHYFRTALDLTYCLSDVSDPNRPGFYLIKMLASEQAGLTGFKGSIVRKVALSRSSSSLKKSLAAIKAALE